MITEALSTLKIHKLTQAQYDKALAEGRIKENELYLTPDVNNSGIYFSAEEPVDAPDESLWIDTTAMCIKAKIDGQWIAQSNTDEVAKDTVLYVEQTLFPAQQAQARTNIGAAAADHSHTAADLGTANIYISAEEPEDADEGAIWFDTDEVDDDDDTSGCNQVQANFNQNDAAEPDYIQGRTHWTEGYSIELDLAKLDEYENYEGLIRVSNTPLTYEDLLGATMNVLVGGSDPYSLELDENSVTALEEDGVSLIFIGELAASLLTPLVEGDVEIPVGVYFIPYNSTICTSIENQVIHKLDEKYLPDTVTERLSVLEAKTSPMAEVGQYLVVKAVDENGKMTEVGTASVTAGKPVVGVDYFTEADKNEIINSVISSLANLDEVRY